MYLKQATSFELSVMLGYCSCSKFVHSTSHIFSFTFIVFLMQRYECFGIAMHSLASGKLEIEVCHLHGIKLLEFRQDYVLKNGIKLLVQPVQCGSSSFLSFLGYELDVAVTLTSFSLFLKNFASFYSYCYHHHFTIQFQRLLSPPQPIFPHEVTMFYY